MTLSGQTIQLGRVGAPNMAMGEPLPSGGMIYLLGETRGDSRFNGACIGPANAVIFQPGQDFILSHNHPHVWLTLQTSFSLSVGGTTNHLIRQPTLVRPLLQSMMAILESAAMANGYSDSHAGKVAERIVRARVMDLIADPSSNESRREHRGRPARKRSAVLQDCHDFLNDKNTRSISVKELAKACYVSERTLQSIFVDYFGFGPSRFLQYRQLYRVHRDLVELDPGAVQVSTVLLDHGVWHFSHFGRRYKSHFGCTPKQTLEKSSI